MSSAPRPPPDLPRDAHKGVAGRVLLACGSAWMPGAALLAARAAQRAGAGLVRLACREPELVPIVAVAAPECVFLPDPLDALAAGDQHAALAGPGLGLDDDALAITRAALARASVLLVLDADALSLLAREPRPLAERAAPLVLTPHPGEAARLLGREIPADPAGRSEAARAIARAFSALVVLKGAGTVVTDGERVLINDTGNPGLATAGAGDVLAGILVAYLAQTVTLAQPGWSALDAVARAVWVHGRAGDLAAAELGSRAVVASDLVTFLPAAQRG
ncbi:MAG: NAD(P)H-hydrate dehydratase [Planctomycetes bacterium]|nr:NAD(P)H-hydrate dehydratase [Planctomycetota bacterium]